MAESKSKSLKLQGFSTKGIAGDLSAGMTKSIDSVTGGMANAVLAGVNPVFGLYTVLAATPIGALFTSSVYMNIDSTGAIAATAGSMLIIFPEEQRPAALAVLTLLVGVFMLAAGLLKLGFLTRFISNAVLRGFLTGIGVNIILGQLVISPATPASTPTKSSKRSIPFCISVRSIFKFFWWGLSPSC